MLCRTTRLAARPAARSAAATARAAGTGLAAATQLARRAGAPAAPAASRASPARGLAYSHYGGGAGGQRKQNYAFRERNNYLIAAGLLVFILTVYFRSIAMVHVDDFEHPEVKELQSELDAQFADRQREKALADAEAAAAAKK